MTDLARDYDHEFFKMHIKWKADYFAIADMLNRHLRFQSVIDLGCGNRYILSRLEQLGKVAFGIDGSPAVLQFDPRIIIMDITQPVRMGQFDLVICTEVAEHIEEKFADMVVSNVASASKGLIFFSAAIPGRGGHLHVNEQQPQYWLDKFAKHKFRLDEKATALMKSGLGQLKGTWWFEAVAMVLTHENKFGMRTE